MNKLLFAVATLAASSHALALDISDDELKERGLAGEIELGLSASTGNTEESNLRGRTEIDYFVNEWRHHTQVEGKYTKSDSEVTAERYYGEYKADRVFSDINYGFGQLSYEDDQYNSMDDLVTVSSGYGHRFNPARDMVMDTEIGPGYRWNQYGEGTKEWILRAAMNMAWKLSATSKFSQKLTINAGDTNTMSRSETALKTTVIGALAMKLSVTMTHQTTPESDDSDVKEKLDTVTAVTLLYGF